MKIIKIKQPINDNMGASFKVLTSFLQQINKAENEQELIFDLTKVKFAYPFFILPLAAIINRQKQLGKKIRIKLNPNIEEYFKYIFFPYGFTVNNNQWQQKLDNYSYKTYLPVCTVLAY